MPFEHISYLELWRPFCSVEQNHSCNFGIRHHEEQFCEIILNLDQTSFKDISYMELWWPFCSADWNHLCNFGRGYYEELFCESILNLG